MGNVVPVRPIAHTDENGAVFATDDYWSFLKTDKYYGFCHFFFCFYAVYLCHVGTKKRALGWLFTGAYILLGMMFYSIFQEISVVATAAGSLWSWNKDWQAGDQTFDLLWNVFGVLFGMLYLLLADPVPNVVYTDSPRDVAQSKLAWLKSAAVRNTAISVIMWMIILPIGIATGGVFMLKVPIASPKVFRLDFLFFAIYVQAVILLVWIVRAKTRESNHLLVNAISLDGRSDKDLMEDISRQTQEENKRRGFLPIGTYEPREQVTNIMITRRVNGETLLMISAELPMMVIMCFPFLDNFYLQTLIACGVGVFFLATVAVLLRVSGRQSLSYASGVFTVGRFNPTGASAVQTVQSTRPLGGHGGYRIF